MSIAVFLYAETKGNCMQLHVAIAVVGSDKIVNVIHVRIFPISYSKFS